MTVRARWAAVAAAAVGGVVATLALGAVPAAGAGATFVLGGTRAAAAAAPANLITYGITSSGALDVPTSQATIPGAFPVVPTVVSNSNVIPPGAACGESTLVLSAIVAGSLTDVAATFTEFPSQCGNHPGSVTRTTVGSGWGGMRQLVNATYTYALNANGSLYRYSTVQNGAARTLRGAGSVAGFGTVKSMALVHSDARKDVLLMNLSGGALYQVTIPVGPTMRTTVAPVRTRSWNGFEQLITAPTPKGAIQLQGVDKDSGQSFRYDLGPLKGTATTVTSLGSPSATTTTASLVQGGTYDGFPYRGAP